MTPLWTPSRGAGGADPPRRLRPRRRRGGRAAARRLLGAARLVGRRARRVLADLPARERPAAPTAPPRAAHDAAPMPATRWFDGVTLNYAEALLAGRGAADDAPGHRRDHRSRPRIASSAAASCAPRSAAPPRRSPATASAAATRSRPSSPTCPRPSSCISPARPAARSSRPARPTSAPTPPTPASTRSRRSCCSPRRRIPTTASASTPARSSPISRRGCPGSPRLVVLGDADRRPRGRRLGRLAAPPRRRR